jgi:hemerythrin-like metal-binding protein
MINGWERVANQSPMAQPESIISVELLSGNKTIDSEHKQLFAILAAARSVCRDLATYPTCVTCSESRRAVCESELVKLLGRLLSVTLAHFRTEESIMRESLLIMVDRHACEAHMEDHAAISSRIERIIATLDSQKTVGLLRELDKLLGVWVLGHIATHDMALVDWIEREDSALRSII